ncbi:hypothetical protein QBC47DRAFT_356673 [Echria macrotheca]|uniref:2EXR domain-containing protein n=1 Tax=Echria macrotheca TaxID=438768 RepID=A0AAJ0BIT2_9PEZI|nr:hypothetical protein QBC47DRAFT_356673 [Echria macrotheca]
MTSFTLFPRLPYELKAMIWDAALRLDEPGVHFLPTPAPQSAIEDVNRIFWTTSAIEWALWETCKESRRAVERGLRGIKLHDVNPLADNSSYPNSGSTRRNLDYLAAPQSMVPYRRGVDVAKDLLVLNLVDDWFANMNFRQLHDLKLYRPAAWTPDHIALDVGSISRHLSNDEVRDHIEETVLRLAMFVHDATRPKYIWLVDTRSEQDTSFRKLPGPRHRFQGHYGGGFCEPKGPIHRSGRYLPELRLNELLEIVWGAEVIVKQIRRQCRRAGAPFRSKIRVGVLSFSPLEPEPPSTPSSNEPEPSSTPSSNEPEPPSTPSSKKRKAPPDFPLPPAKRRCMGSAREPSAPSP